MNTERATKFLSGKNYGSIGHLPDSRLGPGDRHITQGQAAIATEKTRDGADLVIVQEKLDGSNVGVYRDEVGQVHAVTRAGYLCKDSHYEQHKYFDMYVEANMRGFDTVLRPGERIIGEWLMQAHGTRYRLSEKSAFVAFDIMRGQERLCYYDFMSRVNGLFATPPLVSIGDACSIDKALRLLGPCGRYGAEDLAEGLVYRVERHTKKGPPKVDFLAKYVRGSKEDGCYLKGEPEWNVSPAAIIFEIERSGHICGFSG